MKKKIELKSSIIIALLFLVDFVTFLADYMPVTVLKVMVYITALFLAFCSWKKLSKNQFGNAPIWNWIGVYIMVLFIRVAVDFLIPGTGFFLYKSPSTILFFFIMTIVFPYFMFKNKWIEVDVTKICLICGVVITLSFASTLRDILSGTIVAATTGGQFDAGAIDIISYGHYGLSLLFIAVYVWMYSRNRWMKLFALVSAPIGLSGIVLSGSRSPIIALLICGVLFFISQYKRWYYLIPVIIIFYLLTDEISYLMFSLNDWLATYNIGSFNRIVESLFGKNNNVSDISSGRNVIFIQAWENFSDNMLFGYGYLLSDKSYVHNIFIENFMALGLFGGVLFTILNIVALRRSIYVLKNNPKYSIFVILFVQYLVLGFFSRTTIANAPYWMFMLFVLNNYDRLQYENRICSNPNV